MRALVLLLMLATAACASTEANAPSLAPRAAEAIDPRVPVGEPAPIGSPDPRLVQRLDELVAQASSGDEAFNAAIGEAQRLAEAAGPTESESWIVAQQALSKAVSARAPVTGAVGEIDALGSTKVVTERGVGPANGKAIEAAAAKVALIDDREAAAIAAVQAILSR